MYIAPISILYYLPGVELLIVSSKCASKLHLGASRHNGEIRIETQYKVFPCQWCRRGMDRAMSPSNSQTE